MNDSNTHARLRLALIPGLGPMTQGRLVQRFGSAAATLERVAEIERAMGAAVAQALRQGPDPALLDRTLQWAREPGHRLLAFEDAAYPPLLREIPDPPGLLYSVGDVSTFTRTCVAIVGARSATPQGLRDAQAMARALSEAGLTIVSGLALGIDAAAHAGGLAGRGSSIAVTGTGADIVYPRRNASLARRLAEEGCVVTEFALGTPPVSGNFPRRNRLISGLSRAVMVVEANEDSGSLLTAGYALVQDRDVLAMPGSIHSPLAKGCHKLIKQGAALIETANDVLGALGLPIVRDAGQGTVRDASRNLLLRAMGSAPVSADQIALRTGLAAANVAAQLSHLQIAGRVEQVAGGRFQRVERSS